MYMYLTANVYAKVTTDISRFHVQSFQYRNLKNMHQLFCFLMSLLSLPFLCDCEYVCVHVCVCVWESNVRVCVCVRRGRGGERTCVCGVCVW